MRFKIDENLPVEVAALLQEAGHDATTIHDEQLVGQPDSTIIGVCNKERRAIITLDLDFADIRTYPPDQHLGLVVLRLRTQEKGYVTRVVERLISSLPREPIEGRLWIVEENRIRMRG